MKDRANIVWPAAVIALLVLSGVTTFGILIASRSDGGAQVVDNYYRKSVTWDSVATVQRASSRLGWIVRVELDGPGSSATAVFKDSTGSPVAGLTGSVTVSRPQSTTTHGTHSLNADETSAGHYRFEFPYAQSGLWDLDIVAHRGDEQFVDRLRIEI